MCPYTVMLHNVSVYCHAAQRPFYENTSRILVIIWCTSLTCGVTGSSSRLWDNNVRIIIILFWTFFWFRIFIQYSIRLRMFWNMCRFGTCVGWSSSSSSMCVPGGSLPAVDPHVGELSFFVCLIFVRISGLHLFRRSKCTMEVFPSTVFWMWYVASDTLSTILKGPVQGL